MSGDTAENRTEKRGARFRRTVLAFGSSLMLTAVTVLLLFTQVLAVVSYHGDCMEPGISDGDKLILLRTRRAEQGDVITFYYNNQLLVRRVIAEGGQRISIAEDGTVSVDGSVLEEPYLKRASRGQCNITFPHYIPPDNYFVMGDDRTVSMDSRLREIGTVSKDRIMGKVLIVI